MTDPNVDAAKNAARLDKITKLLAKAEDPACTPAEAEAFSEKALRLMAEWMIDDADVQAHRSSSDPAEQIVKVVIRPTEASKRQHRALVEMGCSIAEALNCKGFIQSYRGVPYEKALVLVGYASDVERVRFLWTSLQAQVIAPREAALRAQDARSWEPMSRQEKDVFRTSFIIAFGSRCGTRLWAARKSAVSAAGTGTELVLLDRSAQVKRWVDDSMKIGKARNQKADQAGYVAGREAGDRATLATGEIDTKTATKALAG